MFYKNITQAALVKATEEQVNGLWLCMQGLGKGQGSLCNLLDISESKTKNGFLKTHLPAGVLEGGRKEPRGLDTHVFESPGSVVGEKGGSMFVMLMKGKSQNREKRHPVPPWEEEGRHLPSKSVDLPSGTTGQWGGVFDRPPNDLPNADGMPGWSPHYAMYFHGAHANMNWLLPLVDY